MEDDEVTRYLSLTLGGEWGLATGRPDGLGEPRRLYIRGEWAIVTEWRDGRRLVDVYRGEELAISVGVRVPPPFGPPGLADHLTQREALRTAVEALHTDYPEAADWPLVYDQSREAALRRAAAWESRASDETLDDVDRDAARDWADHHRDVAERTPVCGPRRPGRDDVREYGAWREVRDA